MRIVLSSVGVLLLLMGTVWFFQGIGVLPGSFMSGQPRWAVYGGLADCVALGALWYANRLQRDR